MTFYIRMGKCKRCNKKFPRILEEEKHPLSIEEIKKEFGE